MSSLWIKNGVLQLNADEALIYDVSTPIEECCCACDILYAIYERQIAQGITTAWDAGDPYNVAKLIDNSGNTSYTLPQLKAYVAAIAEDFVDGTYSGGASAPTMLLATYADGAADVAALLVLVKAMLVTKISAVSLTAQNTNGGYGQDDDADRTTAETTATTTAYGPENSELYGVMAYAVIGYANSTYRAISYAYSCDVSIAALGEISSQLDMYAKAVKMWAGNSTHTVNFNKQGYTSFPDENNFGVVSSALLGLRTGYVFEDILSSSEPPPAPTSFYSGSLDNGYYGEEGFKLDMTTWFVLATWDFTCI